MAAERKIYIDNGENINAAWLGHLAISWDGVAWETISKDGLDVSARTVKQNADAANRHPGEFGKGTRGRISLKRQGDVRPVLEFDVENVANQAGWIGGTIEANKLAAVTDITSWCSSAAAVALGGATEATLISVLNAIVASDQDIEILLVRDTVTLIVYQQITNYETGVPVVTYKDVNGTPFVPVNPMEYLDPSAVMNLLLTEALDQGLTLDDIKTAVEAIDLVNQDILTQSEAINDNTSSKARVTTISRETTTGTVSAGANEVSFSNDGNVNATIKTVVLYPGQSITFNAGLNNTLDAYPWVATGTDLLITTIT